MVALDACRVVVWRVYTLHVEWCGVKLAERKGCQVSLPVLGHARMTSAATCGMRAPSAGQGGGRQANSLGQKTKPERPQPTSRTGAAQRLRARQVARFHGITASRMPAPLMHNAAEVVPTCSDLTRYERIQNMPTPALALGYRCIWLSHRSWG